jgi:hypothetical protein
MKTLEEMNREELLEIIEVKNQLYSFVVEHKRSRRQCDRIEGIPAEGKRY